MFLESFLYNKYFYAYRSTTQNEYEPENIIIVTIARRKKIGTPSNSTARKDLVGSPKIFTRLDF